MIARLDQLGMRLDADAILRPAIDQPGTSIGRPAIARALVAAGYVSDTNEAFAQWLSRGRPGVRRPRGRADRAGHLADSWRRRRRLARASGVVAARRMDRRASPSSGLDAIEAYHTNHDETLTAHYRAMAQRLELGVSGGSDYHADESHGAAHPGSVSLPRRAFDQLRERATSRATASGASTSS